MRAEAEPKAAVAGSARQRREPGMEFGAGGAVARRKPPVQSPGPFSTVPSPRPAQPRGGATEEDHTLQLLPGRMEVAGGGLRAREIRFIRTNGDTYTLGRQSAPGASHIQIENATVSRKHAAMRFTNGRWTIRNLSATNPMRINGVLADAPRREYELYEGDRVEMGEVVFVFREQ